MLNSLGIRVPAVFNPLLEENEYLDKKFKDVNLSGRNGEGRIITVNINTKPAFMSEVRARLVDLMSIPDGNLKKRVIKLASEIIELEKEALASTHNTRAKLEEVDLSKRMCIEIMKHHKIDHHLRRQLT